MFQKLFKKEVQTTAVPLLVLPKYLILEAEKIIEILIVLMRSHDEESSMWKGRAISMIVPLIKVLCDMRDHGGGLVSFDIISNCLLLERYVAISRVSSPVSQEMNSYLKCLPGYDPNNPELRSYENHGYITMQFAQVFDFLETITAYPELLNYPDSTELNGLAVDELMLAKLVAILGNTR